MSRLYPTIAATFHPTSGCRWATKGDQLFCTRSLLGRRVVQPLAQQSHLLSSFNKPINMNYMYVLREDAERAGTVLKRLALDS